MQLKTLLKISLVVALSVWCSTATASLAKGNLWVITRGYSEAAPNEGFDYTVLLGVSILGSANSPLLQEEERTPEVTPEATPTPTPTPSPTPTPLPPLPSKSLTENIGANTLAGLVGGGAVNYASGANQLTGWAAAGYSGALSALGAGAGTYIWNLGRSIFDPPEGQVNQPELWRLVPILLLVILALLAGVIYSARKPTGRSWAKAVAAAILLGIAVGLVSLLVDQATGWEAVQRFGPVIFLVYGVIAGFLEYAMLRGVGPPRRWLR